MPQEREFERAAWIQQQQQQAQAQAQQSRKLDPGGPPFPYGGGGTPMDHSGGPPVLVVPPNNACVYPPSAGAPPPNRFCVHPPPPYKRPYPPEMTAPEQQFWDQQQAMFEQQQQQAMLMQQQQQQQQQQHQQALVANPTPTGGRANSGRSGLSKKRKSTAAANRQAPTRPPQPQPMPPFGAQRLPGMKPGGFGSVPIGPPRGSTTMSPYQAGGVGGDPSMSAAGYPVS